MNLCSASINGPAAYLCSISLSQPLVEIMLGWPPGSSLNTSSTVTSLSITIARPDWQSLDDIDVPLHQHSLSVSIDNASHHQLLTPALSDQVHALALSSGLPHAGDWLNKISSSAFLCDLLITFTSILYTVKTSTWVQESSLILISY